MQVYTEVTFLFVMCVIQLYMFVCSDVYVSIGQCLHANNCNYVGQCNYFRSMLNIYTCEPCAIERCI